MVQLVVYDRRLISHRNANCFDLIWRLHTVQFYAGRLSCYKPQKYPHSPTNYALKNLHHWIISRLYNCKSVLYMYILVHVSILPCLNSFWRANFTSKIKNNITLMVSYWFAIDRLSQTFSECLVTVLAKCFKMDKTMQL